MCFYAAGRMSIPAAIQIRGLRKVFPNGVVALDGVDLDVAAGEILGVVGRSGTGKSTLIRCVNRLEEPTAGSIHIDGRDVTRMRGAELRATRRQVGMIFQQFNLLTSRTAIENVALPLEIAGASRAERRRRALELLDLVGLADRADFLSRRSSPAARSSGSGSPARWPPSRRCCCPTRPPRRSTPRPRTRCSSCCGASTQSSG